MAPKLYPNGIEQIDVALYDSESLYLWSRAKYDLPRFDHWHEYTIYRTDHHAAPSEQQMARCAGGEDFVRSTLARADKGRFSFTCSPMGAQTAIQRRRDSIYDTRDSYLATIAHEYAHQYSHQELWQVAALSRLAPYVKKLTATRWNTDVLEEAFAIYCELLASRMLYPAHYERLRRDFYRPGSSDSHSLGFRAAADLIDAENRSAKKDASSAHP